MRLRTSYIVDHTSLRVQAAMLCIALGGAVLLAGCDHPTIEDGVLQFAFDSRPAETKWGEYAKDRDYYSIKHIIRQRTWLKADLYLVAWPGPHEAGGCVIGVINDRRIFEVLSPYGTRELPLNRIFDATQVCSRRDLDSLLSLSEELYSILNLRYSIARRKKGTNVIYDKLQSQISIDSLSSGWEATYGLVIVRSGMGQLDTLRANVEIRIDSRLDWISEIRRSIDVSRQ